MFKFDRKRILAIAKEAVNRKGFVVYADYDEHLRELICQRKIGAITGWKLFNIKKMLLDRDNELEDRYRYEKKGNKAYFYPLH